MLRISVVTRGTVLKAILKGASGDIRRDWFADLDQGCQDRFGVRA